MEQVKQKVLDLVEWVITHGEGKIEVLVSPRFETKTNVRIIAGKTWNYLIDRVEIEED